MPVDVACPACNATYKVPENILGRSLKCKACQTSFTATAGSPFSSFAPGDASAPAKTADAVSPAGKSGRGRGLVVVLLALLVVAGVGGLGYGAYLLIFGGASWQEFASTENGFTVLVPAKPTPAKNTDPKMGIELREFVAKRPSASFTVQVADLREKPINDWLYFAWQKNMLLGSQPEAKLADEQDLTLNSFPG